MKSFQNEHVKNLPDAYRKDSESNNYKMLQIEKEAVNEIRTALQQIDDILDLDNAKGSTLDMYGERVGQPRGRANDEQYLLLIKSKIFQNLSNGTHNAVVEGLSFVLKCDPADIVISDGEEACSVEVSSLPLDIITAAEMTTEQVLALIKRMLPATVELGSFMFAGSFEFGSGENEQDTETGFSDVGAFPTDGNYENVIGGYLGVTTGDTSDVILPI